MKHTKPVAVLLMLLCLLWACAILLASCGGENPATENALTAVIADGKGEITVKAVLTDEFLDSYLEKKVYLFELPSFRGAGDTDLTDMTPVAEAKAKAEMTLTVSLTEGARSRLYSSFLLASYDHKTDVYTPLTQSLAVTELSDMAPSPKKKGSSAEVSIKGLISDHPGDAIRLGISHTVVDVPMDRLILKGWQEGAFSYMYSGVTRYLNADELDRLDRLVSSYTSAGVKVYLRFVLGAPADGYAPPSCLYAPMDAAVLGDGTYCAVNMEDSAACEIMEGFFDLMADRYASPEAGTTPVTSFLIGYRVNHSAVYNAGGSVESYEKLVRVARTALLSHNTEGRVYLSLDSLRTASEEEARMDIPTFMEAFTKASALRGAYDWHVACELYADAPRIWDADGDRDTRYYTVQSLRELTELLTGEAYTTPAGEARRLLISGFSVPATTPDMPASRENNTQQAASYAFAYLTCVGNGHVEALIYDTYADTALSQSGLWSAEPRDNGTWTVSGQRPLYGIFKKVDTTEMKALSGGLSAIIDTPYTRLERELTGTESPVTLLEGTGTLEAFSMDHSKDTPLFTFTDGSDCGFDGACGLTYMELSRVEVPDTVILYSRFDRDTVCDPMAITVTLSAAELMERDRIMIDLYAGACRTAEAGEEKPTVTLRLTRPSTGAVSEGKGALIYDASVSDVSGGVWQSAVFEVGAFTSLLGDTDEVTLTLLLDYDPAVKSPSANHMGIAGIYTAAPEEQANALSSGWITVIVAVVAVAVVGGVVLALLSRRSRR